MVVYLAFLKPGDSDPLDEIQIEDGGQVETMPMPNARRQRKSPATKRHAQREQPSVTHAGGDATQQAPPATQLPPAASETPAGSQYASSVTRINEQMSRAHN